jgi:hypothetical protein
VRRKTEWRRLCRFGTAGAVRMWDYLHSAYGLTGTVTVTCQTVRPSLSSRHSLRNAVTKTDNTVFVGSGM